MPVELKAPSTTAIQSLPVLDLDPVEIDNLPANGHPAYEILGHMVVDEPEAPDNALIIAQEWAAR